MSRRKKSIDPDTLGDRLASKAALQDARRRGRKTPERRPPRSAGRKTRSGTSVKPPTRPLFSVRRSIAARIRALETMPSWIRAYVVLGALGLFAVALVIRSVQLQLIDGPAYRAAASDQGTRARVFSGRRGRILDRNRQELATTLDAPIIEARREAVEDRRTTIRTLARILGVKGRWLAGRLEGDRGVVELARRASPAQGRAVRKAQLPGVTVREAPRRMYAKGRLAAHVLGFVDRDLVGQAGIERAMEAVLRGSTLEAVGQTDARRRSVWSGGLDSADPRGRDVVLTLDQRVQYAAERALSDAVERFSARAGMAVVLDVATSDVLALVSLPDYNPNNLAGTGPEQWRNRAIIDLFDPGSTAKIVTVAAALDAGVVTPETPVDCEQGRWRVGDRTIRDANHAYGVLSVADVMKHSSNIGAAKLGLMMGSETLHRYLDQFGFGRRTGLGLDGESKGILRPASRWREVDLANIAFGQGISVTALQVAQAANIIAAGGLLRPPRLVAGVLDHDGGFEAAPAAAPRRVVSARTAAAVGRMMATVTEPDGTAPKARLPGIAVAGKTGTAQKFDRSIGRYSRERYVASFVGYAPAEAPAVTVLVVIDEPRGAIYGGRVASAAFRRIALAALESKELYASGTLEEAPPDVPVELGGSREAEADEALARAVREAGAARVREPANTSLEARLSPAARALLGGGGLPPAPEPKKPETATQRRVMPDLRGQTAAEALRRCAELGLTPDLSGAGRVRQQRPRPGAPVVRGGRCTLELGRDG